MTECFKQGINSTWTVIVQLYKLHLENADKPEIQIANIHWIIEKAREFQEKICFIDYVKVFVWITTNGGIFLQRCEYQTTLPASWETCMQVNKQQLEPDTEQRTGSKLGKEYVKAAYCHPLLI